MINNITGFCNVLFMVLPAWLEPLSSLFTTLGDWMLHNQLLIFYSIIAVILGYLLQRVITGQIDKRMQNQRLGEHLAHTLILLIRIFTALIVLASILIIFKVDVAAVTGFISVVGGTILGFAAINTLGNAIAGFIVIMSRPFRVGDRIFFQGKFSDVISIGVIYTKLRTLDLVFVSVPNQELLKSDIENYGKMRIVRRRVSMTAGYEHDNLFVKKVLLEAVAKVDLALKAPKPFVSITDFQNYAVEYTLFYFIREVKKLPLINAQIRDAVFTTCRERGIDMSTPLIVIRNPEDNEKNIGEI